MARQTSQGGGQHLHPLEIPRYQYSVCASRNSAIGRVRGLLPGPGLRSKPCVQQQHRRGSALLRRWRTRSVLSAASTQRARCVSYLVHDDGQAQLRLLQRLRDLGLAA
jgi:hypothetical protein